MKDDKKETPELELTEVKVNEKKATPEALKQVPQNSGNSISITKKILESDPKVKLLIPSTEKDKSAVFASVNGMAYNIPRDKWVEVPISVVKVLENAKYTELRVIEEKGANSATIVTEEVSRIPFQTKA